jgi:putative oxidoreductase
VRRSFSNFARGWPATGLLVIRSLVGLTVINHEIRLLLRSPLELSSAISVALILSGILLIIGLWTPIAAILAGVLQVPNSLHCVDPWMCLRLGIFASALAMVGPGGWSVDARLFGWKRLEVPQRATNGLRSGSVD